MLLFSCCHDSVWKYLMYPKTTNLGVLWIYLCCLTNWLCVKTDDMRTLHKWSQSVWIAPWWWAAVLVINFSSGIAGTTKLKAQYTAKTFVPKMASAVLGGSHHPHVLTEESQFSKSSIQFSFQFSNSIRFLFSLFCLLYKVDLDTCSQWHLCLSDLQFKTHKCNGEDEKATKLCTRLKD